MNRILIIPFCVWAWLAVPAFVLTSVVSARAAGLVSLERSFWLHASLASDTRFNYWGTNFPAPQIPTKTQVQNALRLLTKSYAANRLYLIYHREVPTKEARQLFTWWRKTCPRDVELIPTLVLSMY